MKNARFSAILWLLFSFALVTFAGAQSRPQSRPVPMPTPATRPAPRAAVRPAPVVRRPVYSGNYYGYNSYNYYRDYYNYPVTGLKFSLDLVPKGDQKLVKRGIVSIDGAEVGIVNTFDGWYNRASLVVPGEHEIVVELEDGRVFQTIVRVVQGQTPAVYLRFSPPEK